MDTWKEKAENWLNDTAGYAPDTSVEELAGWMEKAEKWDTVFEYTKISMANVVVDILKRGLRDSKKLKAIRAWGEKWFPTFRHFAPIAELEELLLGPTFECRDEVFIVEAS